MLYIILKMIRYILILLLLIQSNFIFSQPGPFGSDLIFTLRKFNSNIKVYHVDKEEHNEIKVSKYSDEYVVSSRKTPVGGWVKGHIEIISEKKDTMRIFDFAFSNSKNIIIKEIPFRKGNYKIPKETYIVHNLFKQEFRQNLRPSLNGNWSEFEIGKEIPLKEVYLKRIELFKNTKIFSSLFPYPYKKGSVFSSNPYFLKDQLKTPDLYETIIGNGCSSYRPCDYYNYFYFGIIGESNIFIFQKEDGSPIEYGMIKIPIYRDVQQKKENCYKGLLYPNLEDKISFTLKNLTSINFKPYVLGYYDGKKRCDENFGTVKEMWGIFQIYIDKPDKKTMHIITNEHTKDNGLK